MHALPIWLHKINEALREHGLSLQSLYLPTAYASDLRTPATVKEADDSDYSKIWRSSRV